MRRLGTATSALSVFWRHVVVAGHHPDTFVGLSHRELAAELELGAKAAGNAVRRLVVGGALEADGDFAGSRPVGYRFRDLSEWDGMPWRKNRPAIEVALIVERWLRPVEVAAPPFARAHERAQTPIARVSARALARGHGRALTADSARVARAHERAQITGAAGEHTYALDLKPPTPTRDEHDGSGTSWSKGEGVLYATIHRVSGRYLAAEAWRDRVRKVADHPGIDLERLAADLERVGREERAGPPRMVMLLEQLAAVQLASTPADAAATAAAELERARGRRDALRAQVLGLEQAGYDDDELAKRRSELEACENRVSELEGGTLCTPNVSAG